MIVTPATTYAPGRLGEALIRLADRTVQIAEECGWQTHLVGLDDCPDETWREAMAEADAVVLLGGHDVHPNLYGGTRDYPGAGDHLLTADRRSIELIAVCRAAKRPLLGICRGMHLVNVAYGGTLIEHLEDDLSHRLPDDQEGMVPHEVTTVENTVIASLIGERSLVQSSHHQGVRTLGTGLMVSAVASGDDTVEAIEDPNAPVLGVQWHPEDESSEPEELPILLSWLEEQVEAGQARSA